MSTIPNSTIVYSSGAKGPLALRFVHYNDVYHISQGSRDPVGGAPRFMALIKHYHEAPEYANLPAPLTVFSGDAFNPSLESAVTKGKHMVPIMNNVKTSVACLGNHDLDFGVDQFMHLAKQCEFPWLCANVVDPALGGPIAGLNGTCILESGGIKIGFIGLVEKEWLDTINTLPPDLQFQDAVEAALELAPELREAGAELVVVVSHQREPNDQKLAREVPAGLIDIILGGHDHHYAHEIINGCHVIRSGTDFRQLSYVEVRRKSQDGTVPGWDFDIVRRDITTDIPEDEETVVLVDKLNATLRAKLEKPVGFTSVPLDARFSTVRARESNLGNFVCDLMRYYYAADCALMAAGTIRGDQIYPPGNLKLLDIVGCFPFEDPVVVIKLKGSLLLAALENGLSKIPALEGRFPQVSNITFSYDPELPSGSRIVSCQIGGEDLDLEKEYTCATRQYMVNGKDGFTTLMSEAGAEQTVEEENGVLISLILRQYFLSLKALGKWRRGEANRQFFSPLKRTMSVDGKLSELGNQGSVGDDGGEESSSDVEDDEAGPAKREVTQEEKDTRIMDLVKKMGRKWTRLAGLRHKGEEEFVVHWTQSVAPRLEGRITVVKKI